MSKADHICDTGNFDRTLCPEPCGYMHSYCDTCGKRQDPCAHDRDAVVLNPLAAIVDDHRWNDLTGCECGPNISFRDWPGHLATAINASIAETLTGDYGREVVFQAVDSRPLTASTRSRPNPTCFGGATTRAGCCGRLAGRRGGTVSWVERTWPENAWPTAEQLHQWVAANPDDLDVRAGLERLISDSQRGTRCFLMNHDDRLDRVSELEAVVERVRGLADEVGARDCERFTMVRTVLDADHDHWCAGCRWAEVLDGAQEALGADLRAERPVEAVSDHCPCGCGLRPNHLRAVIAAVSENIEAAVRDIDESQ